MKVVYIVLGAFFVLGVLAMQNHNNIVVKENIAKENFVIEKVMEESCSQDDECETPGIYLMQSRCPFTSKCIKNKCTVICPDF